MEISSLVKMKPITALVVIETPSGRFCYAGRVPVEIGYVDATPEKIAAAKFGERFGPKRRTFDTAKDAVTFAESHGFSASLPQ